MAEAAIAQRTAANGDLVSVCERNECLVVGFFTPDYRSLAMRLADNLRAQGLPYHLFAVKHSGDWSGETKRKPEIALHAMETYPTKLLVFMDVDCIVNGSLATLHEAVGNADFSCFAMVRVKKFRRNSQRFSLSSRVMAMRAGTGSRKLMQEWIKANRESSHQYGDERGLVVALARSYGLCFSPLPETYSGREEGASSNNFLITHQSAGYERGKRQSLSGWFKDMLGVS